MLIDDEGNGDRQIHTAMIDDIQEYCEDGGTIQNILFCGDIANSCEEGQYEKATKLINEICSAANCEQHKVYVVPGNHDKDRSCNHPKTRDLICNELRSPNGDEYFIALKNKEFSALEILYAPLKNYYEFAAKYSCCDDVATACINKDNNITNSNKIYWKDTICEKEGFSFNLHGINSVLTSGKNDKTQPLFLPKLAYNIAKSKFDVNILMMHHPITKENIINHKEIEEEIDKKFQIQFYGHEHLPSSEKKEAIKIFSGALNPHGDYDTQYCPAYNIIEIDVFDKLNKTYELTVDISSYKWDKESFIKDEKESVKHILTINNSKAATMKTESKACHVPENIDIREVQYKFMSNSNRWRIIKEIIPDFYNPNLSEHINSIAFLKRLQSEKRVNELWNLIK